MGRVQSLIWLAIIAVMGAPAMVAAQDGRAAVSGTVYDSVARRRISGAKVQLVSTSRSSWERSVTADADGRFRFDSLAAGSYLLGFYDAALDSLGLEPPLRKVDVRDGVETRVPLAIASVATIVSFNCRNREDSTGLFLGVVRSAKDGSPVPRARVRVRWIELSFGSAGLEQRSPFADAIATAAGNFALCGIPASASSTVQVRAWSGSESSGFVDLDVPTNGLLRRDLFVGASTGDTLSADTADMAAPRLRGEGRVHGVILSEKARPVERAHVTIVGSGADFVSGADGSYSMHALPTGTYTLEARAIGFLGSRRVVDIVEGTESTADVTLASQKNYLDTVRVLGLRARAGGFEGFERRRETGMGIFLDEEKIREIRPIAVADLFRSMRSVHVSVPGGNFDNKVGYNVTMSGPNGRCTPNFFLNGVQLTGDFTDIDHQFNARDIVAVEVYRDWGSVPGEYQSTNFCGAIVIWAKFGTKRR